MRYLELGKTGLSVSEFGFGGIPIIRLGHEEAVKAVRHAYEAGVTLFDTANKYMDSEDKMGAALDGVRDKVVLATKTGQRNGEAAMQELERSLRLLRTDYIDIYQAHQVSKEEEFQAMLAPGGVMEMMTKAKEQGKIRCISVSSHNLEMAVRLVESGLFSTIQFPWNYIETAAETGLFPKARAAGVGILVMKPFAGGMLDDAALSFKYLRGQPDAIPLPGFDSIPQVDQVLDIYSRPNEVTQSDLDRMQALRDQIGTRFCRRCEYCQPCPQGVSITFAMMYRVVTIRLSPAKAINFSKAVMESVRNCIECGECETKCPYNLPIREMLHEHLDMYDAQRAQYGAGQS